MKFAIVGCGGIGFKRMQSLGTHGLLVAADRDISRAENLCKAKGQGIAVSEWQKAVNDPGVDIVIVSVINNMLAPIAAEALLNGKHVIVEKPAGRNLEDLYLIQSATQRSGRFCKVGFNHRFHPSLLKAKELIGVKNLGEFMFIRGRYGHGGRVGYDKEWRFEKEISGGGELIDQGVHLIDLSRWLSGLEFPVVDGHVNTSFWDTELEDNGFMSLRTETGQTAWLHVSATEWKNTFSLEVYFKFGKLQIDGLGGSYGLERLTYYKMLPQMGPPETAIWEFPFADTSWQMELKYFIDCIEKCIEPDGGIYDALKAMEVVQKIYENEKVL
jgi:predicted dehydrogenase